MFVKPSSSPARRAASNVSSLEESSITRISAKRSLRRAGIRSRTLAMNCSAWKATMKIATFFCFRTSAAAATAPSSTAKRGVGARRLTRLTIVLSAVMRPATLIAAAGGALFLVCCVLAPGGPLASAPYGDVHLYATYAERMASGEWPYRDFFDEYPPLAQPLFLFVHALP